MNLFWTFEKKLKIWDQSRKQQLSKLSAKLIAYEVAMLVTYIINKFR